MLNFNFCRFDRQTSRSVAPSTLITAEGTPLVADNTVVNGVKPATGAAGEIFVGVTFSQQLTILAFPYVEDLVPNASNQFTLAHAPSSGTLRILDTTTSTPQTAGTPGTTANQYSISGQVVTVNSAQGTDTMRCWYRYVPTTVEARSLQGDTLPGGAADLVLNTVGVVVAGDVYTTEYDSTVDWTAANIVVKLGANGLFTIGGSGGTATGVRVISPPTPDNPYLGLAVSNG